MNNQTTRRAFLLGGLAAMIAQAAPVRAATSDAKRVLIDLYSTVGQIYDQSGGLLCTGSAILLDDHGTLAMCQHEALDGDRLTVRFARHPHGFTDFVAVKPLWSDTGIDLAFGTLGRTAVKALKLKSARRASPDPGNTLIGAGFPGHTDRLSFSRIDPNGNHAPFSPADDPSDRKSCNDWFNGTIYEGESGGGSFALETGAFAGVFKATSNLSTGKPGYHGPVLDAIPGAIGAFTPADAVWAIYDRLLSRHPVVTGAPSRPSLPRADCMPYQASMPNLR